MSEDTQTFINLYIERILKEVTELTKTKLLLETQMVSREIQSRTYVTQIEELQNSLKDAVGQVVSLTQDMDNLNKRIGEADKVCNSLTSKNMDLEQTLHDLNDNNAVLLEKISKLEFETSTKKSKKTLVHTQGETVN
jgi:chromosome segregation ATPase